MDISDKVRFRQDLVRDDGTIPGCSYYEVSVMTKSDGIIVSIGATNPDFRHVAWEFPKGTLVYVINKNDLVKC